MVSHPIAPPRARRNVGHTKSCSGIHLTSGPILACCRGSLLRMLIVRCESCNHMAVSINWGVLSWVSLKSEPCFLGSIYGPLMFGNLLSQTQVAHHESQAMQDKLTFFHHMPGYEIPGCILKRDRSCHASRNSTQSSDFGFTVETSGLQSSWDCTGMMLDPYSGLLGFIFRALAITHMSHGHWKP